MKYGYMKSQTKTGSRTKRTPVPDRALVQARLAQVKPTIVQTRAPLREKHWEHALTCPLPLTVSYEMLDTLRKDVLDFLDWVTQTMPLTDHTRALREIQRVADRLTRIVAMTPKALETGLEEGRLIMSDDVPF
jgi:hypothetical protein